MRQTWKLIWQTGLLAACYWSCEWLVRLTGLPVPGNVLGIIVLFTLLCTGIVKEAWISEAATFLLKHLVFFFVPIAVGLMNWWGVFYDYGWVLLAALLISSLLPLLAVGWLSAWLQRRKDGCPR